MPKKLKYKLSLTNYKKLQTLTEYKAKLNGIPVQFVKPEFTSKDCSKCSEKANTLRPYKGNFELFHCNNCGITINANYNAAVNIAKRALNTPKEL
jgi:transposase